MTVPNFDERLTALGSDKFRSLRPAQQHVLGAFAADRSTASDVGIELPTGEGKTLIALIADWALDEGMSVAYLTGTKQLAEQVECEAAAVPDVDVHRFASRHYPAAAVDDHHQAQAVGVLNYWVYFNSRPKIEPADLVIFDDAHLAEQPLAGLFTLRVPRTAGGGNVLYQDLCELVLQWAPNAYPTLKALRDGSAPSGSPPELIAFNDWAAVADSASDLVDESVFLQTDKSARIVWQTLRTHVTRCGVRIGPTALEIRPYHPPTQTIPGYAASKQRIYLSATLGRPGDLQRRIGVRPTHCSSNGTGGSARPGPSSRPRLARARSLLNGSHDERAEALEVLARLCGTVGDRPGGKSATNARWVWATPRKGQRRVWEVKTGTGPDAVPRDHVNQLLGQVRLEQDKHPKTTVVGCLLTG